MDRKKKVSINLIRAALAFLVLTVLVVAGFLSAGAPSSQAAPPAVITPVASSNPASGADKVATWYSTQVITLDEQSTAFNILNHEFSDIQVVVDQGAGVLSNTTTLSLEFSNDKVNWPTDSDVIIYNASLADANTMSQHNIHGRWARIDANVTNANPITVTVIGVLK